MSCSILPNLFSDEELDFILELPEVKNAKKKVDSLTTHGSIYFSIDVYPKLKPTLEIFMKNGISDVKRIPMRWVKGDTKPHIDNGMNAFDNTHLVYITDSKGELIVDDESYPICRGAGYIFQEGLSHQTWGTGREPRLLLGPMSDTGFAVGAPSGIYGPGGSIIYIRQNDLLIEYSSNRETWNEIYWPIIVVNTDPSGGYLNIQFTTDITINNNNQYFVCDPYSNNGYIQFGSSSLKNDGTRPVITIDGVSDYYGLIQNGASDRNANSNIYVFNLEVHTDNGSTLSSSGYDAAGWIGQAYFGKGAIDNYVINCASDGPIGSQYSGGIIGSNAGSGSDASGSDAALHVIGCSSSGELGSHCGGIVGYQAAISGGTVYCESCWSTGAQTSTYAGGIFGDRAGVGSDSAIYATNCYSTGYISVGGGGICGASCGRESGSATISNCYSTGYILEQAGGIIGRVSQNTNVINCYTTGNLDSTTSGGICGDLAEGDGINIQHCYTIGTVVSNTGYMIGNSNYIPPNNYAQANGTWTTTNANTVLQGLPNPVVGTTWVANGINQPYLLFNIGYTPYGINNITDEPDLRREYNITIGPGQYTEEATVRDLSYQILQINGGDPAFYQFININLSVGSIFTIPSTTDGVYEIYVRNVGSYHISVVYLTILYVPPPIPYSFQKAMPPKDITSDGTSSFSTSRYSFIRMLQSPTATSLNTVNPVKKWVGGSRDSSTIIANRRISVIGNGSLNAAQNQMSFATIRDINTVADARRRVRAGGATVPMKSRGIMV